jgi:hypothetical protein
VVRQRTGGRTRDCSLAVLIPRWGERPQRANVYIGTENTYSVERFNAALERAVAMRQAAVEAYHQAATKAKRAEARAFKAKTKGL